MNVRQLITDNITNGYARNTALETLDTGFYIPDVNDEGQPDTLTLLCAAIDQWRKGGNVDIEHEILTYVPDHCWAITTSL